MRWPAWLFLLVFSVAAGCSRTASQPVPAANERIAQQAIDDVLHRMRQRLVLMHDVARWKWTHRKPIADPEREQALLMAIQEQGARYSLDPAFTQAFFAAQIEAAKLLQEHDFRRWEVEQAGPFPDVPDLPTALRPRIDAINTHLLQQLARVQPFLQEADFGPELEKQARTTLTGEGITEAIRQTALAPLYRRPPAD